MSWTVFYKTEHQGVTIGGCIGSDASLTLPNKIDGFPVVRLGLSCFAEAPSDGSHTMRLVQGAPPTGLLSGHHTLKYLTLPSHLQHIDRRGLENCSALVRLELPQTIQTLGPHTFDHCRALRQITLPEKLTVLPDYAFADCRSLETIALPNSITTIGNQCFYNCKRLRHMELPLALRTVGSGVFMNCSHLAQLAFPAGINASVLLADLYQKLEVTIHGPPHDTRLLFPEYAYEFEDIVMPRQFRTITYGSGGRYRECINGESVDLELYDSLFRLAKMEESRETAAMLALFRLMDQELLRPEIQTQYLTYLLQNIGPLGREIMNQGAEDELDFLLTHCGLERAQLDILMECARQGNRPRFVSRILEVKGSAFSGTDKTFDL